MNVCILEEKNMQVLTATASVVFVLFWKACYLCRLPHVTTILPYLFFILLLANLSPSRISEGGAS